MTVDGSCLAMCLARSFFVRALGFACIDRCGKNMKDHITRRGFLWRAPTLMSEVTSRGYFFFPPIRFLKFFVHKAGFTPS